MGPMAMASSMGIAMQGMPGMAPGMTGMALPGLANLPAMNALGEAVVKTLLKFFGMSAILSLPAVGVLDRALSTCLCVLCCY